MVVVEVVFFYGVFSIWFYEIFNCEMSCEVGNNSRGFWLGFEGCFVGSEDFDIL